MIQVWSAVTRFLRWKEVLSNRTSSSSSDAPINVEDEYQKACRTESYLEFTKRAHILLAEATTSSSTSHTVSSLELLAATLLEPDQEKVLSMLVNNKDVLRKPELFELVSDYFEQSSRASKLCTMLLRAADSTRERRQDMQGLLKLLLQQQQHQTGALQELYTVFVDGSGIGNPLLSTRGATTFSQGHMNPVHEDYVKLQNRLVELRKRAANRLRAANRCLKACRFMASAGCVFLMVITTAALFLAVASFVLGCKAFTVPLHYVVRRACSGRRRHRDRIEQQWRQSEAVAHGTFVVIQDLDTIKRLVLRLASEVESATKTLAFCKLHEEDALLVSGALGQVGRSSDVIEELLEDLEVSLHLCFMRINRARALVVRELCLR